VLSGVLAFVGALAPGQAGAAASYGSVTAHDGTLRSGCHHYAYHYAVQPPTGDWVLATKLKDPRGKRRGNGYFLVGGDPTKGPASFTICSDEVVPGRFTITARLTWYDDPVLPILPPTEHHASLAPAHFRLTSAT
jgi:hypothetical protein